MRARGALVLILFFPLSNVADTLQKGDLIGNWRIYTPEYDIRDRVAKIIAGAATDEMYLTVSKDYEITFVRRFDDRTENLTAEKFTAIGDTYIIWLERDNGYAYKLVLSGWSSKGGALLFGHFYLYNNQGLFNGWGVTFEQGNAS